MDPLYWTLPSGQRLPEFALHAGFAAPLLLSRANTAPVPMLGEADKLAAVSSAKGEEGA